jgi:hypothetical protein
MKNYPFRLSLVFFFILAGISPVIAQSAKSTWMTTSLGLNSCWILNQNSYGNQELDYGTKFGINASIGANYFINNQYGISTGIAFGNLGQNYQGEQADANATRKINLKYIQVPLLVMKQLRDPQSPCWLTFGPQLMFLASASQTYSREEGSELPHPEYLPEGKKDVTKWYKPADVMLNLGYTKVNYVRTNDKVRMMWTINMAYGLFDINAEEYQIENIHGEYKPSHNFYIGAQIGLMFNP